MCACVCVCVCSVKFSLTKYYEVCRFLRNSTPIVCMASLTVVVIPTRGLIFQPCALIPLLNGLYLFVLICMLW